MKGILRERIALSRSTGRLAFKPEATQTGGRPWKLEFSVRAPMWRLEAALACVGPKNESEHNEDVSKQHAAAGSREGAE